LQEGALLRVASRALALDRITLDQATSLLRLAREDLLADELRGAQILVQVARAEREEHLDRAEREITAEVSTEALLGLARHAAPSLLRALAARYFTRRYLPAGPESWPTSRASGAYFEWERLCADADPMLREGLLHGCADAGARDQIQRFTKDGDERVAEIAREYLGGPDAAAC
jgi:hypothetical protein